jgi:hypothetical protein
MPNIMGFCVFENTSQLIRPLRVPIFLMGYFYNSTEAAISNHCSHISHNVDPFHQPNSQLIYSFMINSFSAEFIQPFLPLVAQLGHIDNVTILDCRFQILPRHLTPRSISASLLLPKKAVIRTRNAPQL